PLAADCLTAFKAALTSPPPLSLATDAEIEEKAAHLALALQAAAETKASAALVGVGLLARAKAGLAPKWVRQVVEAVVMPRLTWGTAVWYDPKEGISQGLLAVQRAAARLITGGYRTISLDTLEVEANIPPLNLVLRRHLHHFALQLHSSSPSHPCHTPFQRARTS
ncbi:hypothetical protein JCM11251_007760, partial [Rhodosporidiobolus azoricus]